MAKARATTKQIDAKKIAELLYGDLKAPAPPIEAPVEEKKLYMLWHGGDGAFQYPVRAYLTPSEYAQTYEGLREALLKVVEEEDRLRIALARAKSARNREEREKDDRRERIHDRMKELEGKKVAEVKPEGRNPVPLIVTAFVAGTLLASALAVVLS